MSTVTFFDTLKFAERLKQAGVPEEQAKAMSEAQNEVFSEALETQLTTKKDLADLKLEMIKWIVGMGLAEIGLLLGILMKH